MICNTCKQSLANAANIVFFESSYFHSNCLVCCQCQTKLNKLSARSNGQQIYCIRHEPRPEQTVLKKLVDVGSFENQSSAPQLLNSPALFQVAKYNIHPTPVINFPVRNN